MTEPTPTDPLAAGLGALPAAVGRLGLERLDHIAIVVRDLEPAVLLFRDLLGGEFIGGGDDAIHAMRTLQFALPPGVKIELMTPIGPDSHLHRFLAEHGGGFHHATLFVQDVAAAAEELVAAGFEVVDTDLRRSSWQETYIRPRSGFGTLLQLVTSDREWTRPLAPEIRVEDVLAGRVAWIDDHPVLRTAAPDPGPSGG